jgi:hypothetical protein
MMLLLRGAARNLSAATLLPSHVRLRGQSRIKSQEQISDGADRSRCLGVDYVQPHYTEKIVVIFPSATTTLAASTSTFIASQTATSTSTDVPADVSVTISFSTTVLTMQTTTETATLVSPRPARALILLNRKEIASTNINVQTNTIPSTITATSTVTFYAACGPDNLLGPVLSDGSYIDPNPFPQPELPQGSGDGSSAYACCVSCLFDDPCAFAVFYGPGNCQLAEDPGSCSDDVVLYFGETSVQTGVVLSNGYCGSVKDVGPDPF